MKTESRVGRVANPILAFALVTLVAAAPLAGQAGPRDRAREVLPAELFSGVEALAADAVRGGAPEGPIFNKALEGMAKRVPPPLLLDGLRGYADRLVASRGAFGPQATTPMLMAGADALQRGVSPETLRGLGEGGPHSPMAVMVLADLVESGVPTAQALRVLHEAVGRRMGDDAMLRIPDQVRRFMREGHSPGAAAERVWTRMRGGMGGDPAWTGRGVPVGPGVPPGWVPSDGRGRSGRGG